MILSLILLLLPLIPPSRRHAINRPNQATTPSKISSLVTLVKEKRRQIRGMGIKRCGDETATGAAGIRDSSKRTVDIVGLNEDSEGIYRLRESTAYKLGPSS